MYSADEYIRCRMVGCNNFLPTTSRDRLSVRILDRLLAWLFIYTSHMIVDYYCDFNRTICQDCLDDMKRLEHAPTGYGSPLTTEPNDFVDGWLTRRPSAKMEGKS